MGYRQAERRGRNYLVPGATMLAVMFLLGSACRAQNARPDQKLEAPWSQDLSKYPGLAAELARLFAKLQQNIQFPAERHESKLLPLLPPSTVSYVAFSNYGDAADQVLKVFRQELAESAVLRDWWAHGQLAASGPKVEDSVDKFSQISQYLGDEIVVSTGMEGEKSTFLAVCRVRKAGLKMVLEQMITQLSSSSKPAVRVLGPEELSAAREKSATEQALVLVRPDFVVVATDLATLRGLNARLDAGSRDFASTAFGQRVAQEYRDGVTVLAAADLHEIVKQVSPPGRPSAPFQHSGFADSQYLVWDHKTIDGKRISQVDLSFTGPRHGTAAWLANSGPLGGLDFVSSKAAVVAAVNLSDPGQIFDDAKELSRLSGSNAFATIPQFERALNLSLKDDLLSLLSGELTVELDEAEPPQQYQWKAMLQVKDASHLQHTLSILTGPLSFGIQPVEDGGVTYYGFRVPSGKKPTEIDYAFADSHLILGSSRDAVAEAVNVHKSGGSLAKSKKFLAALPPQSSLTASALFYQDPVAAAAMELQGVSPGLAGALLRSSQTKESVVGVYGESTAIREVSTSPAFDASGALIVAAIAIPNLLRSRIAANEASAVGSLRTINVAQISYSANYPDRGFAPNLAMLGMDPHKPGVASPERGGYLSESLANQDCAGDGWCTKSGYRFRLTAVCQQQPCRDFVAIATPVSGANGTRSFCSTSDAVIRYTLNSPISAQLSVAECRAWMTLQ
jgi:type IV pilus assembly protein PilA